MTRSKIRPNLTSAHVISIVALIISLSSVSYAAVTLSRNSVATRHIKNSAVTGAKVKLNTLTGADLAAGSVGASEVAPGAVAIDDLAAGVQPGGVLTAGVTLHGVWGVVVNHSTPGLESAGAVFSFGGYSMPNAPVPHVVHAGTAPGAVPECSGTAASPEAASGHLCVYITSLGAHAADGELWLSSVENTDRRTFTFGADGFTTDTDDVVVDSGTGKVATFGFRTIFFQDASNIVQGYGSWAATS